jgi:hypothetical protein
MHDNRAGAKADDGDQKDNDEAANHDPVQVSRRL